MLFVLLMFHEDWPKEANRFCGVFSTKALARIVQKTFENEFSKTLGYHFRIDSIIMDADFGP